MYNPPESGTDSLEFIEIYNNDTFDVNLNNYYLAGVTYTFGNITLAQNERLVVSYNADAMLNVFNVSSYQWTSGGLSNGGELVAIYNPGGELVDEVFYDDANTWPNADGSGHSIVLCDINTDNNVAENWTISTNYVTDNNENYHIWASPGQSDNVCTTQPILAWSDTVFTESTADDGSISTVLTLTLTDDEFVTTGTLVEGRDYAVANVPAGLNVVITTSDNANATIELLGNASNHANADDVNNMEITFADSAFVSGFAANINGYSKTNLTVDFTETTSINTTSNNSIKIYPNPAKDIVNISANNISNVEFFDITGKQIKIEHNKSLYNISNLQKGVYFVKIYINEQSFTQRLIVE
jgi:hypothetical protein